MIGDNQVLVSDWQSLTMKRVPYKQGMTLEAFRINVSIEFGKAQKILKLYHVPERNEAQWTDPMKRKVAKENFDNVIAEALSLADEATYPIIYAHFDNSSPTSSPGHLLAAETTSIKSAGSSGSRSRTDQQNFRSVLLERDGNMCRICCATQAIEAAHIIEWSAKLNTVTLYKDYHISGKFDYRNGLMLCSECHDQYDSYEIGILPTGDVIPKTGTKNEETRNIFTTARQDNFDQPTELVLGYKYKKFVAKHISTPKRKGIFKKLTSLSLGT